MSGKGVHAEEEYLLADILSGCIVNSYMSVTDKRNGSIYSVRIRWSATGMKKMDDASLARCRRSVFFMSMNTGLRAGMKKRRE